MDKKINRKISKELFPYACKVMEDDGINYAYKEYESYFEILARVSSRRFNGIVEDAKAMKETETTDGKVVVLSYRSAAKPARSKKILEQHKAIGFTVLGDQPFCPIFA